MFDEWSNKKFDKYWPIGRRWCVQESGLYIFCAQHDRHLFDTSINAEWKKSTNYFDCFESIDLKECIAGFSQCVYYTLWAVETYSKVQMYFYNYKCPSLYWIIKPSRLSRYLNLHRKGVSVVLKSNYTCMYVHMYACTYICSALGTN
jgi:hypothetical protein